MDAVSSDVAIRGSQIILGVEFPPVDDIYNLKYLHTNNRIKVKYYVADTDKYTDVTNNLFTPNSTDNNLMAFMVSTANLREGVIMVQVEATIPSHDGLPERKEMARCSSRVSVIK